MTRDRSARTRIREFLSGNGPVNDPSGYATSMLRDAIEYQGSSVAFIQLIVAMERDGEVLRDIKGKRTYQIAVSTSAEMTPAPATTLIDYEAFARAIVRELWATRSGVDAQARAQNETPSHRGRSAYARSIDGARQELDHLLAGAGQFSSESHS